MWLLWDKAHPGGEAGGGVNPLSAHRHVAASEWRGCPGVAALAGKLTRGSKTQKKATSRHSVVA